MRRLLLGMMLACVTGGSVGCTTCCTPYDHCGPTYTGGPGESCDAPRQGSILDYGPVSYESEYDGEYQVEYGPDRVIDDRATSDAPGAVPHEANARRTKLRPIPDRTTMRVPNGTIRR
jgi:hypothetical protein